jgi:hypothetical protein
MNEMTTGAGPGAQPQSVEDATVEAAIADYVRGSGGSVEDIVLQRWLEEMEQTHPLWKGKITATFYAMLGGGRIVRDHDQDVYRLAYQRAAKGPRRSFM